MEVECIRSCLTDFIYKVNQRSAQMDLSCRTCGAHCTIKPAGTNPDGQQQSTPVNLSPSDCSGTESNMP